MTAVVDSPCTKVCTLDAATGWCTGCMRTVDEIAAWGALTTAERAAVMALLPGRGELLRPGGATSMGELPATRVCP